MSIEEALSAASAPRSKQDCGCAGHGGHSHTGKSPADSQAQPSHSTRNKRELVDHSTVGPPCCCGGKTASKTGGEII